MEAGFQSEQLTDPARDRPILIDWWYPVAGHTAEPYHYGLAQGLVVPSGPIATGRHPLVLMSHGAMGAARDYSWLSEALARSGFLVAGVSHFGESYLYGLENIDPEAVLRSWERPLDVSAALTFIETGSSFRDNVDMNRVGFAGHSSGGATAMQLAGARFDGRRIAEYCSSAEAADDRGCDYARNAEIPENAEDETPPPGDFADPRIRAFVALDPALGPGFSDFTAVDPDLRVLIVGSVDNDFLPFDRHAEHFAANLPAAETCWLREGEGHFIYLNSAESDLEANGVPLFVDQPGVSREAVHQDLQQRIVRFFAEALTG